MENKIQNIYFQNLSQLNLPSNLNLNILKTYSSPYQNIFLILSDNNIIYKGKYIPQENQKNFIFEKIKTENKPNNNNTTNKYILCDFTSEHIYLITKEKNEILISDYNNFPYTINNLPGILQKKKIKSISCGINSSLLLTYGGMVYTISEQNKESQTLINDLLEYNISNIYSGGYHFFCKGKKRNSQDENDSYIFSWGDNTFAQCGFDNINTYINKPKIVFKNININNISLGKNHTMILTNNLDIIIFGDNQFYQCSNEKKAIIQLVENDNILPLTEINYYTSTIDYLVKNNEIIDNIEAKGDSSLIITHKKSIILKGKITEGKEIIFRLNSYNNNNDINSETNTVIKNNNILFCFGGDNYFLVITDGNPNENYYEIKSGIYNSNNINNLKKLKLFNDSNSENIISKISNDDNILLKIRPKFKNSMQTYSSKYKTISSPDDLTFEELKKDQYQSLNSTSDLSEASLSELRSYISLLGISFTSSYNDSNLSFRPKNLPPKSKEEENLHRQMVYQNRQMYINLLKQKKALEEANTKLMEQKYLKEKTRAEFWNTKIIPNWSKMKNSKNIKKFFYEGIPASTRGKIWALCIGNKFCITKEYYDIEANKSIQLLIKLNKNNNKKKIISSSYNNNNKIGVDQTHNLNSIESSDNSSMSLAAKKFYSKYIKQTLDKEKSISLIDLDIERTFSSMGIFKNESQLGNNLREILRIFVVARPDIGYVQGLSYIAGTLLLQMDKFTSFVCFMNIILSPNILPFYRLDEEKIKKRLDLFNEILKSYLPKLYKHFEENEILPEHYLLEWFMTLFTRNLNIDLALRIWDIYMIEGISIIYKSALVIFKLGEKQYLNMDFAEIMNNLKNLDKNNIIINEDKFVEELNNIKFGDKILNKIHQFNEEYLIYE